MYQLYLTSNSLSGISKVAWEEWDQNTMNVYTFKFLNALEKFPFPHSTTQIYFDTF